MMFPHRVVVDMEWLTSTGLGPYRMQSRLPGRWSPSFGRCESKIGEDWKIHRNLSAGGHEAGNSVAVRGGKNGETSSRLAPQGRGEAQ
jgi:hypothetical protein